MYAFIYNTKYDQITFVRSVFQIGIANRTLYSYISALLAKYKYTRYYAVLNVGYLLEKKKKKRIIMAAIKEIAGKHGIHLI